PFQFLTSMLTSPIDGTSTKKSIWKGTVKATSSKKWQQEINTADKHYVNEFNNASMQALRTSGLLMQTLERERLNNWPIRSLVVFTNENAKVLRAKNKLAPQTDIILKHMLPNWFKDNARKDMTFNFSRGEFNQIKSCLVEHTQPYAA
ncbi:MAG: nuclease-related domain-containing protein, partial [Pseudomonadota bacterium]